MEREGYVTARSGLWQIGRIEFWTTADTHAHLLTAKHC